MWAVIAVGSKQYKVEEGQSIKVDRIISSSAKITLDKVLLYAKDETLKIGKPYLDNVKVEAEILGEEKAKKVVAYKYKRRKGYQRKRGHRQIYTLLKILKIKEE